MNGNKELGSKTVKGVFWTFLERASAQIVSFVVSIVLARILLPDDYSVVGIVAIFFAFANVIISGGLSTALIQKKEVDDVDYSSVLFFSLLIAAVIYVALFFTSPLVAGAYSKPILIPIFRVMGITLFVNVIKSVVCAYISRRMAFKMYFFATLFGTIVSAVVGIIMAKTGFGAWALVAQQMTNVVIDTLILIVLSKFRVKPKVSIKKTGVLFKFGWKIFANSLLNETFDEVAPLIIGRKFSTNDLSFYSKGRSFPRLISLSINDTIQTVLFPAMSKVQDDKAVLLEFTRRFIRAASFVLFPIMIGLFVVSDNFVLALLTEKWLPASIYIKIFCLVYLLEMIQMGNLQAMRAIGRSDIPLILNIFKKIFGFTIIIVMVIVAVNPVYFALAYVINIIFATILNTFPNRKLIGYKYKMQIKDIAVNLIISIIMGAAVYFIGFLVQGSSVKTLIMQVFFGAIVYFLLNSIVKNKSMSECKSYLLKLIKRRVE